MQLNPQHSLGCNYYICSNFSGGYTKPCGNYNIDIVQFYIEVITYPCRDSDAGLLNFS